mgnify:CR=1 FL=1
MGFEYGKKYDTPAALAKLRYGKLMIMCDQDVDGSHIKGLLINMVETYWPELIKHDFVHQFITPLVRVYHKRDANKHNCEKLNFYSMPELKQWQTATPDSHQYIVDYYKGLGTSTSEEFKEYFADLDRHRIEFCYSGAECADSIQMAFSKDRVDDRKIWIDGFMTDARERIKNNENELMLYNGEEFNLMSFFDFVQKELVVFSYESCKRSIPCTIDGLKPSQRKVLWTCLKRNDRQKIKVAQLGGSVAELSAYHHGEMSLIGTIVKMAQDYVGGNNVNMLEPLGQFGTRVFGGKDHAAARYIHTKLSPITRALYPDIDDQLLTPFLGGSGLL